VRSTFSTVSTSAQNSRGLSRQQASPPLGIRATGVDTDLPKRSISSRAAFNYSPELFLASTTSPTLRLRMCAPFRSANFLRRVDAKPASNSISLRSMPGSRPSASFPRFAIRFFASTPFSLSVRHAKSFSKAPSIGSSFLTTRIA